MKQRGFLAVIFVIGCATGGVASQLVVPPARAGTAPMRWEYLCWEREVDTAAMNKAGAEGWELVTMAPSRYQAPNLTFCWKRALQ